MPLPWMGWTAAALVAVLDLAAIARAVYRGHGVDRTLAWIFGILAFPGVGALLYLALASPSVPRTTRRKRRMATAVRRAIAPGEQDPGAVLSAETASLLRLASRTTGLPPSAGNAVDLLADEERAFGELEGAVRAARRSVWAEYYLIRRDETGMRFLDLLADKAREGIEVRLLYDGVGSLGIDEARLAAIRAAGGRADVFLPVNPLRRRWSVHLRNHRKIVIVDHETGFTGGMNVGDEYSGRARRRGKVAFHDTHLKIRGPAVGDLAQTFAEDWYFATDESLELPRRPAPLPGPSAWVAVVPSGPDQEQNANGLVHFSGIAAAQRRVYVTSPYFVPDEPMIRALASASLRGLDVRVLVPEKPDVRLVGAASRSYFPVLVQAGVRIWLYRKSMLHAKTLVVDDAWGIVGSANMDIRSYRLNFELGALVVDPVFAGALRDRFHRDLDGSQEVTAEALARRSLARRLGDGAARLLSPLL